MRQLIVRLKPWESRKLRQLRDHATSSRVVKRAACLLRSAAGDRAKDIARVLGLSVDAVSDIRRRWRRRRMRSVRDRPRSGRPPLATAGYLRDLRRAMRAGPLRCGYVFTVWSVARLGAHLKRRTGVRLGGTRLRRLLTREGFVVGRPGHTLRGKRDEAEYERARRRLARLKRGALKPGSSYELWYADATEFDLLPHLTRCWMRRGRQVKVPTPGKNRKVAAFGAVCYGRRLFVHHTQPTVNAAGMQRVVRRLLRRARRTGRKIVLVLDRGNPNHAHALHRELAAAEPRVKAFWLPSYCWNLNLIERLWKHVKGSRVANALFRSYGRFVRQVNAALEDFARHPDLTFPAAKPARRRRTFGKT